ncbi:protein LSM12 homolog isoform X2 [Harmonia axyridis]|uniref:protein LSM12 homolog isoform X2 n=1 Tax=Harmonia axyridis TaxID=115357 RepID=UPI001E27698F|nr:protein LSM12 homolog isoform X2 [Harmonia axyridis]
MSPYELRRRQCVFFEEAMAAITDCFTLGSVVWCRTCCNTEFEGEVLSFDSNSKILILKCCSSNGDPKLNDIHFINLSLVSELRVKRDSISPPEPLQSLNIERISIRLKNQVEEKRRILQAKSTNASTEGQSVFIAIAKVIDEISWKNSEIVVWNQEVIISPPYQLENIKGDPNNKGFNYIKKVVEKHWNDYSQSSTQNCVQSNSNANYK